MEVPVLSKRVYRFGLFQIDSDGGKLLRHGVPIRVQEQPLRVLCLLLERPGELVTREQLRESLWPDGTSVEFDGSLNSALKRLRFALGDDADNPVFIETVPRRGYRFIAPVECEQPADITRDVPQPAFQEPSVLRGEDRDRPSRFYLPHWWIPAALAILLLLLVAAWRYWQKPSIGSGAPKVIAVLPFANQGAGPDFDYLRYSIANELVTDLGHARSLTVRPFASTSKFGSQPVDPEQVGKELRVTYVLTGGFLLDQQNLHVNMELVEVARNEAVWRDELTVPPQELVTLRNLLATRAMESLLPAINMPSDLRDVPTPKNVRAFTLYAHSLGISHDPGPNQVAIKNLEESVSLDSGYAPAWDELAWRYYIDYAYGNGGEAALDKGMQAQIRQVHLDPNGIGNTITIQAEQGKLSAAYDEAANLVQRRPDSSSAHYEMSYVLRYAGLLDEAGRECEVAFAIDPGYGAFRSCAIPFILAGNYEQAQKYIRLDENTGFGAMLRLEIALRTGNTGAALTESSAASRTGFPFANLVRLYLSHASPAELSRATAELESDPRATRDPEILYRNAAALSFCGQSEAALNELRKAITGNYCSYPAMEKDHQFDLIRQLPEFATLRQAAIQCQQNFLAHRGQVEARR